MSGEPPGRSGVTLRRGTTTRNAWIRSTSESPERRPADAALLVLAAAGFALCFVWAQAQTALDTGVFRWANDLPDTFDGLARAFFALGSIWSVVAVGLALVAFRAWPAVLRVVPGAVAVWAMSEQLRSAMGSHVVSH